MANYAISHYLTPHAIIAAILILMITGRPVSAIEAGDYQCEVASAVGIASGGDKIELEDAPRAFRLQAVDAPITPDELRSPLHALQKYEPEERPTVSASIDAQLFHHPTTALRSKDRVFYTQGTSVVVFSGDDLFTAYGLVGKDAAGGVAVYSGKCSRV